MKQFFSFILIILLGLQSFHSLAIYSFYYANKDFIASVLCENKEQPQLECKGKCFLKKQLTKAHEQENKDQSIAAAEILVYLATPFLSIKQQTFPIISRDYPPHQANAYSYHFLSSTFRPPCI